MGSLLCRSGQNVTKRRSSRSCLSTIQVTSCRTVAGLANTRGTHVRAVSTREKRWRFLVLPVIFPGRVMLNAAVDRAEVERELRAHHLWRDAARFPQPSPSSWDQISQWSLWRWMVDALPLGNENITSWTVCACSRLSPRCAREQARHPTTNPTPVRRRGWSLRTKEGVLRGRFPKNGKLCIFLVLMGQVAQQELGRVPWPSFGVELPVGEFVSCSA